MSDNLSISFGDDASELFETKISEMIEYGVRVTPQEGEPFDAQILAKDRDHPDAHWYDAITVVPVNDGGEPIEGAEPRTLRVSDVYIY